MSFENTLAKFGYPESLIIENDHWYTLLRPEQITFGSMILITKNEKGEVNYELLKVGCTGLGMFEDLPKVDEGMINIGKCDTLLCYTDGVVELENEKGQQYGIESLIKLAKENKDKSMEELIEALKDRLKEFKGDQPYIDDIALLSVRFL